LTVYLTAEVISYYFRYALELKEKVILNTEQNGAAKIQEDTENLKQEFEKLMIDVQDLRQKLTSRAAQLEEIQKVCNLIILYQGN
jgi:nesprin-1